uniref:Uncharacterized protein n=1 Tax=Arundo donax TaxID=35708 RepID=A0A0A9FHC4_ARUDO
MFNLIFLLHYLPLSTIISLAYSSNIQ